MFLLLKELLQPDGLPAPTHPLGRGVFNETPSPMDSIIMNLMKICVFEKMGLINLFHMYIHT